MKETNNTMLKTLFTEIWGYVKAAPEKFRSLTMAAKAYIIAFFVAIILASLFPLTALIVGIIGLLLVIGYFVYQKKNPETDSPEKK